VRPRVEVDARVEQGVAQVADQADQQAARVKMNSVPNTTG
jgi:hypothetical protein